MEMVYTKQNGTIKLEKIPNPPAVVEIPERIEGCPVTELGAYVLVGSEVEELYLPPQVKKIGAYAFYECEKLRHVSCYSRALDLGTGLFAGAGNVELLQVTQFPGEKSCLKELLSELRQTLRVRIRELSGDEGENMMSREARLIFPEYYEESVENTPARILFIETHGCGHRYRYCFNRTQFQYRDYDELFPHIQVQESEELVTELALGRLMFPCELTERARAMYQEYVCGHWRAAGKLLIGMHRVQPGQMTNLEPGRLPWLVEEVLRGNHGDGQEDGLQGQIGVYLELAQQMGDTETVGWLMDFRKRQSGGGRMMDASGGRKRRRFEL